jgi:hypothetical protein
VGRRALNRLTVLAKCQKVVIQKTDDELQAADVTHPTPYSAQWRDRQNTDRLLAMFTTSLDTSIHIMHTPYTEREV